MGSHHLGGIPKPRAVQFYVKQGFSEDGALVWDIHSRLVDHEGKPVYGTDRLYSDAWVSWELADRAACAMKGEYL